MTYLRSQRSQVQQRRGRPSQDEQGFVCRHCGMYVISDPAIAGVQNRNHCPYCLWSRHLDGRRAGDRLAGCRATMRPIGLTTKRSRNKYAGERDGELMLVHRCTVCARIVLNRIAADDSDAVIVEVFERSFELEPAEREELASAGVALLTRRERGLLTRRLYGGNAR